MTKTTKETPFGTPFITLGLGERVRAADCGCQLEAYGDANTTADVYLCPVHAAAPELFAACKAACRLLAKAIVGPDFEGVEAVRAVLAAQDAKEA